MPIHHTAAAAHAAIDVTTSDAVSFQGSVVSARAATTASTSVAVIANMPSSAPTYVRNRSLSGRSRFTDGSPCAHAR